MAGMKRNKAYSAQRQLLAQPHKVPHILCSPSITPGTQDLVSLHPHFLTALGLCTPVSSSVGLFSLRQESGGPGSLGVSEQDHCSLKSKGVPLRQALTVNREPLPEPKQRALGQGPAVDAVPGTGQHRRRVTGWHQGLGYSPTCLSFLG